MSKKLRVLYPLVAQPVGGVGTFLKSMFEDTSGYEITIIETNKDLTGAFNEYFLERNTPIILFPHIGNQVEYFKECKRFYKENAHKYDIVHLQSPVNTLPHLYYAKKYGIKHRIYHSHATKYSDTKLKSLRNFLYLKLAFPLVTDFFACGNMAGANILGKRKYTIIPNSIDVKKFLFNKQKRDDIRNEYEISEEKIVLGCVGTINDRKNQKLLIEMMENLPQEKYELVFIGTGVNEEKLKLQASSLKNIHFLGRQEDIASFYSMMDIVLIPSKFEGFPMIAVEAQASGAIVIASSSLDATINITGKVNFVDINGEKAPKLWAKKVQELSQLEAKTRLNMNKVVYEKGYDKKKVREFLTKCYNEIIGR